MNSKTRKEYASFLGRQSVKSKFKGLSKEEVSVYMKQVRQGKPVGKYLKKKEIIDSLQKAAENGEIKRLKK